MARIILDGLEYGKLQELINDTEKHSKAITEMVSNITKPATERLDSIMAEIYHDTKQGEVPIVRLEDYLIRITGEIYYAAQRIEVLGVYGDMAETIYKDRYGQAMRNATGSSAKDRDAESDIVAQYERINSDIRSRAYKIGKVKLDAAMEQRSTLKKIITSRMTEREMSNE